MEIVITETSKLNGKFFCKFKENDGKEHFLQFNLDDWKSIETNGLFGGEYIQIFLPERMEIHIARPYTLEIEEGRKVYKTLIDNGWSVPE